MALQCLLSCIVVGWKIQIKVYDAHGNDYRFFEIEGTNNIITEKLNLKELSAGVYFISFSGKDFNRVKKIVIQ
ncbi:MAG: T9SS type A sorting domain-containing protein [Bacteroidales bacterium]|nr:T9SS type A sorting domain-containing protein [Bacteroidales bacterium]